MAPIQLSGVLRRLRGGVLGGPDCGDGALLERYLAGRDNVAFEALVRRDGLIILGWRKVATTLRVTSPSRTGLRRRLRVSTRP
jgi:hypothetical protein